ncbi:MAG: CIA30 family protein [Thalassotalea sp.]
MKRLKNIGLTLGKTLALASLFSLNSTTLAGDLKPVIDDFSHAQNNNLNIARQFLDDKIAGGKTETAISIANGILHIKGEVVPPRGQPGWASSVLLLNAKGLPQDVSHFEGIRLLIKVDKGNVSVSANSAEITNFDYHSALVNVKSDGKFHEVNIPFTTMKRNWSAQTPLNAATINGLSITTFGIQKTPFDYQVDEVTFY